jgi:hypothetical protein
LIPGMTERERLAADLELLGILADPSRGPLAHMLSPAPSETTMRTVPGPGRTWRNVLKAAWSWAGRVLSVATATSRVPANPKPRVRPLIGGPFSRHFPI